MRTAEFQIGRNTFATKREAVIRGAVLGLGANTPLYNSEIERYRKQNRTDAEIWRRLSESQDPIIFATKRLLAEKSETFTTNRNSIELQLEATEYYALDGTVVCYDYISRMAPTWGRRADADNAAMAAHGATEEEKKIMKDGLFWWNHVTYGDIEENHDIFAQALSALVVSYPQYLGSSLKQALVLDKWLFQANKQYQRLFVPEAPGADYPEVPVADYQRLPVPKAFKVVKALERCLNNVEFTPEWRNSFRAVREAKEDLFVWCERLGWPNVKKELIEKLQSMSQTADDIQGAIDVLIDRLPAKLFEEEVVKTLRQCLEDAELFPSEWHNSFEPVRGKETRLFVWCAGLGYAAVRALVAGLRSMGQTASIRRVVRTLGKMLPAFYPRGDPRHRAIIDRQLERQFHDSNKEIPERQISDNILGYAGVARGHTRGRTCANCGKQS